MIFFGQASLQHAIGQFIAHYHGERNHQGLENRLLKPIRIVKHSEAPVRRRQRLGGATIIEKQLTTSARLWGHYGAAEGKLALANTMRQLDAGESNLCARKGFEAQHGSAPVLRNYYCRPLPSSAIRFICEHCGMIRGCCEFRGF